MCPVHGGVWSGYKRLSRAQHEPALTSCACCDGDGTSPRPSHRSPRRQSAPMRRAPRRLVIDRGGAIRLSGPPVTSAMSARAGGAAGSPGPAQPASIAPKVGGIILGQRMAPPAKLARAMAEARGRPTRRTCRTARRSGPAERGTRALRIGGQPSLDRGEVTTHTSVTQAHT